MLVPPAALTAQADTGECSGPLRSARAALYRAQPGHPLFNLTGHVYAGAHAGYDWGTRSRHRQRRADSVPMNGAIGGLPGWFQLAVRERRLRYRRRFRRFQFARAWRTATAATTTTPTAAATATAPTTRAAPAPLASPNAYDVDPSW